MLRSDNPWISPSFCGQHKRRFHVYMSKIVVDFSYHKYWCSTENWCKGNNYDKQPEKQKDVLCWPYKENTSGHYSAEGRLQRKTRKRETKTNTYRRSKRLDWLETIRPDSDSNWKERLTRDIWLDEDSNWKERLTRDIWLDEDSNWKERLTRDIWMDEDSKELNHRS